MSVVKVNIARSSCKDGVVLANGSVGTRMPRGAALPEDDLAGMHDLTCLLLVTQSFTGRVAVVLGGTATALSRVTRLNGTSECKGGEDARRGSDAGGSDGERSRSL